MTIGLRIKLAKALRRMVHDVTTTSTYSDDLVKAFASQIEIYLTVILNV